MAALLLIYLVIISTHQKFYSPHVTALLPTPPSEAVGKCMPSCHSSAWKPKCRSAYMDVRCIHSVVPYQHYGVLLIFVNHSCLFILCTLVSAV